MTMAGDADDPLAVSPPASAARLPPPWFRERDAEELQRMQQLEFAAIATGYNVRLRPRAAE